MARGERTTGRYFSIEAEDLQVICSAGQIPEETARDLMLDTDWPNATEHQEWLDTADPGEIIDWLRSLIADGSTEKDDDGP